MDITRREAGTLGKFANDYLRRDGMFIVRLIGMNMDEVVAGEVLCGLWKNYSPERRTIFGRQEAGPQDHREKSYGGHMEVV